MKVYSIGFTQKKAEYFFDLLKGEEIQTLVDVRLNNVSQLAGFAKRDDLKFFLKELCNVNYMHVPELAPTKDILTPYKKGEISWQVYEERFMELMVKRRVETIDKSLIEHGCLLCSEHKPHHCHRRLVIEYLNECWNESFEVKHLV